MIYFKKVKNKIILIKGTKSTRETRRMIVQLSNFEDYNGYNVTLNNRTFIKFCIFTEYNILSEDARHFSRSRRETFHFVAFNISGLTDFYK